MLKYWLLVLALCPAFADHGGLLTVHFVDVGQGDAIWIQGPPGQCSDTGLNIIIDGGPDKGEGNRLIPSVVEFWQGRPSRLHDRIRFRLADGAWKRDRLAP